MKKKYIRKMLKVVSAILSCALCINVFSYSEKNFKVNATSDSISQKQDKIKELEERNKQIDKEIASLSGDITESKQAQDLYFQKLVTTKDQLDTLNNLLYDKEKDIANKQLDINSLTVKITGKEEEIKNKETEINNLNKENEDNLELFGKMLHALYVTDNKDIFSVLAESADIYDLLVRTKMMINVSKQNDQLMKDIKKSIEDTEQKKQQLQADKETLESDRKKLETQKQDLESKKADLEKQKDAATQLSNQYSGEYAKYSKQIDDIENRQQQLENEKKINSEDIAAFQAEVAREIEEARKNSQQEYQEGDWWWPLDQGYRMITTYFGPDYLNGKWRNHSGIDISGGGIFGANIYASKAGTVIIAKTTYIQGYSYGMYIVVDHGNGYTTLYGHCSNIYVTVGQQVSQGEAIGAVGSTGWSTGPHLHFEVRLNNVPQDPFNYVH